ncbi:MAG: hypothetical protein RLZZ339_2562 [Cyanobacteriota bacterium]
MLWLNPLTKSHFSLEIILGRCLFPTRAFLSDRVGLLYQLEKGNPSALKSQKSDRSAIVYNGLVIGVQSQHPIRDRPASLEAESLARVYDNPEWCEILEKHGLDPEPKPVISASLKSSSYRNQSLSFPCFVTRSLSSCQSHWE